MRRLSKREIRSLSERIGMRISTKEVYLEEIAGVKLYIFNGKPMIAEVSGELIPTLYFRERIEKIPKVVVDDGAAKALKRGADLMAPGVLKRPSLEAGSLVLVVDGSGNPVGIGKAIVTELPDRGKVVKMIHVLGEKDKLIKAIKERSSRKP